MSKNKKRERGDEAMEGMSAADQQNAPLVAPTRAATTSTMMTLDPSALVTADHVVAGQ